MQNKKNKKYSNVSGLLNFQFDRPIMQSPPTVVRKYHKPVDKRVSKAQFLQANFRFNVSPLTSPLEQSLYDPDIIVPWDIVECVVVPMSEDNTLLCPVCLDLVRIPKMTKCGHTFCYTCILRHMGCVDRSNRFKCPMCAEVVCESDLKSVQFVATPSPATSSSSSSSTASDRHHPQVDQMFTFQHVELHKGSLCPQLSSAAESTARRKKEKGPKGSASSKMQLSDVVPCESAPNAPYCRIVHLSVPSMRRAFLDEQRELVAFQFQCLHEHNAEGGPGDVECLPYVAEALRLLASRSAKFDDRVTQCALSGQILSGEAVSVAAGRVSSSRMSDRVGSSDDLSGGGGSGAAAVVVMSVVTPLSGAGGAIGALNSGAAVFVPGGAPTSSVVVSTESTVITPMKASSHHNSSVLHVYQSGDGELVFLLPLCTKCLLDGSAGGDPTKLPNTVTGRVLEVERVRVTSDVRQRFAFLRHLPLQVMVLLVEIDLLSTGLLVGEEALRPFSEEMSRRANKRRERARGETRERRVEEDKRLAEELSRRDRLDFYQSLRRQELSSLKELLSGPAVGQDASSGSIDSAVSEGSAGEQESVDLAAETVPDSPVTTAKSFATITQMGGHFPVLLDPFPPCAPSTIPGGAARSVQQAKPSPAAVPWGSSGGTTTSSTGNGAEDMWARGAKAGDTITLANDGSSKSKKGAKFSLLSNSSGRSYR